LLLGNGFAFSTFTLFIGGGGKKGIWLVKTKCWCVDGGDVTGALQVLEIQLAPLSTPSSLVAA